MYYYFLNIQHHHGKKKVKLSPKIVKRDILYFAGYCNIMTEFKNDRYVHIPINEHLLIEATHQYPIQFLFDIP